MIDKGSVLTAAIDDFPSRLTCRRSSFEAASPHRTRAFNPLAAHA